MPGSDIISWNCTFGGRSKSKIMIRKFIIAAVSLGLLWSCVDKGGKNTSDLSSATPSGESRNLEQDDARADFLLKKLDAGIDFFAVGHEPEWNLNFDMDRAMQFEALGRMELNHPAAEGVTDGDRVRYTSETEMGMVEVILKEEKCTDTMSGDEYDYRVEVKVNTDGSEATTYAGCGSFIKDTRLRDVWVLEELNGTAVKSDDLDGGLPRLEIFVEEGRVAGFDGCNEFNASAEIRGSTLSIGALQQTRKTCGNMEIPNILSGMLMGEFSFEIHDALLIMMRDEVEVMRWTKAE